MFVFVSHYLRLSPPAFVCCLSSSFMSCLLLHNHLKFSRISKFRLGLWFFFFFFCVRLFCMSQGKNPHKLSTSKLSKQKIVFVLVSFFSAWFLWHFSLFFLLCVFCFLLLQCQSAPQRYWLESHKRLMWKNRVMLTLGQL